jgi:hypothetical protein
MEPNSFPIQSSSDHRGKVTFVNDFDMTDVKRTYTCMAWASKRAKMDNRSKGRILSLRC